MRLIGLVIVVLAAGFWLWQAQASRPIARPPGVMAPAQPLQTADNLPAPWVKGEFRLTPVARFALEARVLSRRSYGDQGAKLAPVDLALGWGRLSDSAVLAGLSISQFGRFFYYTWRDQPPADPALMVVSMANMHMIPKDAAIERTLRRLRPGSVVRLEGYLVNATADNFFWNTSTTRTDSGAGACELVWVERITVR